MKKIILLCFPLMLIAFLLVSCDNSEGDDWYNYTNKKKNVNFKGASLNTVKSALQGTWWVQKTAEGEYEEGDLGYMTIKNNKIIFFGGALVDYAKTPEWYDINWHEFKTTDGKKMFSFIPNYPGLEYMNYIDYLPCRIENNILIMGYQIDGNIYEDKYYALLTE